MKQEILFVFVLPRFHQMGESRISSALTTGEILHHLCKNKNALIINGLLKKKESQIPKQSFIHA